MAAKVQWLQTGLDNIQSEMIDSVVEIGGFRFTSQSKFTSWFAQHLGSHPGKHVCFVNIFVLMAIAHGVWEQTMLEELKIEFDSKRAG